MHSNVSLKILLLNPPGDKMYFRDYYCAKVSKARYYYHPIDLVYLSGQVAKIGEVSVIDAIAEQLSCVECKKRINNILPDIIIFLSSAPSYIEDISFIKTISGILPECKMIGSGDVFREYKKRALEENIFLDAILLDFSTDDIVKYITRKTDIVIPNVIYKNDKEIIEGKEEHGTEDWLVPEPKWDKFNFKSYNFPFARRKPFASILTDFGCPFSCDFCPVSTLGFKLRSIEAVLKEMQGLKQIGVKELYIRDQTFGVNKKRTISLLQSMIDAKLNFTWTCLSRTDVLSMEMLTMMKKSGCHTIMIGIESANDDLMAKHKKNTVLQQAKQTIYNIKKAGIRISGFFMIGFPGESKESILETTKLSRSLPIDFASFNIVSPRFSTKFREDTILNKQIDPEILSTESSNSLPAWKNTQISNKELLHLKRKAVKQFYLRPTYLCKRLCNIKSFFEFQNLIREAFSMFKRNK